MKLLDELWKARHPYNALFLELIDGYSLKESKDYPNRILYMKGDTVLIDYDKKTKYAWINYPLIWSVFESRFSLNYLEVSELMIGMMETYLKLYKTKPIHLQKSIVIEMEKNLKSYVTTYIMNHNE